MGASTETGMDKETIFKYNRLDRDRISYLYYNTYFAYPLSIPLAYAIFSHLKWYAVDLSTYYEQI